jgi:hypothetical protein
MNWTIDEPMVSATPGGSPSITYHAIGKNDHLVNITIQQYNFTADEGPGTIEIANIEYPKEVQSNGAKEDLAVYWSGDPQFPVKLVYRPRSCQPGLTCNTVTMTCDVRQNPLVFPESVWCAGVGNSYFDYEVVIVDARGIESAPYPAPFTCKG